MLYLKQMLYLYYEIKNITLKFEHIWAFFRKGLSRLKNQTLTYGVKICLK